MLEAIKQMIQINITLDMFMFQGKWLFVLPFMAINGWVFYRGMTTFFSKKGNQ